MDQAQSPQPNNPPARSWWGRNWKWVVPVGCLTPILVCGGIFTLIVTLVFGLIKSSDPYTDSLASLSADPRVTAVLGTPIEPGFLVTGNINLSGSSGQADISYRVSGPLDSAAVYVISEKSAGQWSYTTFVVQPDSTDTPINLATTP
jgi:Cytochrome oxidase complex assembly protein 1